MAGCHFTTCVELRAKGSLKAGKEQTKKFESKAKEDGEKLGNMAKTHVDGLKKVQKEGRGGRHTRYTVHILYEDRDACYRLWIVPVAGHPKIETYLPTFVTPDESAEEFVRQRGSSCIGHHLRWCHPGWRRLRRCQGLDTRNGRGNQTVL